MCLGIPGKVLEIYEKNSLKLGKVQFSGIKKEVCLTFVPDVIIGDYVIVHVGYALSVLNETEAKKVFEILDEIT